MGITREEAIAELARRRQQPRITKEEAIAELARRRQQQQPNAYQPSMMGKIASGLTGFEEALSSPAAGLLQMAGAPDLAKTVHDYWQNQYAQSKAVNPFSTMGGNIAGQILPYAAGAGIASKIPMVGSMMGKLPSLLQPAASGALGGGLYGASEYVPEGESRLGNAATNAGIGALLGGGVAAPGAIGRLAKGGYAKFFGEKSAPQISKEIGAIAKEHKIASKQNYKNILQESKKANIKLNLSTEKINPVLENVLENGTHGSKKAVIKMLNDPTVKNTHSAMKRLGKASVSSADSEVRSDSGAARKYLEKEMNAAFKNSGKLELAKEFKVANKHYKENVLPFQRRQVNKLITAKNTNPERLKTAFRNVEVKEDLLTHHPKLWKDITKGVELPENRKIAKENLGKLGIGFAAEEVIRNLWNR